MRLLSASLALLLAIAPSAARAREPELELHAPYEPMLRQHYYEQLRKHPLKAWAFELALPGAGSLYVGLKLPAALTLGASLASAGLWIAGARMQRPSWARAGIAGLVVARGSGLVAAPIGALLLNAAFRRQLGLTASY